MEIDHSTPNQTILRERPLFVPSLGLVFLVVGLANLTLAFLHQDWSTRGLFGIAVSVFLGGGMFLYTSRRSEYRLHHSRREFWWTHRYLWKVRTGRFPFSEIQRVVVRQGPEANDHLFRVVLTTPDGDFPLTQAYTPNRPSHVAVRDTILDALEKTEQPV